MTLPQRAHRRYRASRNLALRALVTLGLLAAGARAAVHPLDQELDGPHTEYTDWLLDLAKSWPPKHVDYRDLGAAPIRLKCLETPGSEFYVGVEQVMRVAVPLERMEAVVSDIDAYARFMPGFVRITVDERDGNRWLTSWEQHIPFFLVPNVKYRTTYLVDKSRPGRVIYRYQLRKSERVRKSDGIIVLETDGGATRYTEFDFYDADYGILTTLAPGRIWQDGVEGLFLSDVSLKLRAENPDWEDARVKKEAKRLLEGFPLDEVLRTRARFPRWEDVARESAVREGAAKDSAAREAASSGKPG